MSLQALMNTTVAVQRKHATKDSSGGQVEGFATVAGLEAVPVNLQATRGKAVRTLGQRQVFVTHNAYFAAAFDLRRGDRLYQPSEGRYFLCHSNLNDMGGQMRAWKVECTEET